MGNREFGDLIGRTRTELGVKPEELARRLGRKSKSVVYDLENGIQDPTVADLNILARELHLSVEALLLALGARINPPEAALLDHDLVSELLAMTVAERRSLLWLLTRGSAENPPGGTGT